MEWRLIESAPKDGQTILAWGPEADEPLTVRSYGDSFSPVWNGLAVIESERDYWGTELRSAPRLTHWMPLPDLPKRSHE